MMRTVPDQVRDAIREAGRRALEADRLLVAASLRQLAHDIDDEAALDLRRLIR